MVSLKHWSVGFSVGLCTIIKLLSTTLLYTCSMNNTLGLMGNKMGRKGSHSEGQFPFFFFISEVLVNLSQHPSIFYLCNSTRRAGSQSKLVRSEVHRVTAHHNTPVYKGNLASTGLLLHSHDVNPLFCHISKVLCLIVTAEAV